MLGIGSEEILLVSIVKHSELSAIVYSGRCPIVSLPLGPKFPSDKEYFHVKMHILQSLVLFGAFGRGEKAGKK